jgi:NTP pyrophosphatase (non-canonical NTP hydrolase)
MSEPVTLNFVKTQVRNLVKSKGFPNDEKALTQKLLWAFVELGEATDAFKKGEDWQHIFEELVDTIFYIADFAGLVEQEYGVHADLDAIFLKKLEKNLGRPHQYGQKRDIKQV